MKITTKSKLVLGITGFGFGVWRNKVHAHQTIWTVAIGPVSIFVNRLY